MNAKTTRLSIEIPENDHRKLKILAEANGLTLREFILTALDPILYPKKVPNETTFRAMEEAEDGTGLIPCDDLEDFWKRMGLDK